MEVGDIVKIRPFADIEPSLEREVGLLGAKSKKSSVVFVNAMKGLCGKEARIVEVSNDRVALDCGFWWEDSWVTPVFPSQENIWNDGTKEALSFNLALLRQAQSGNKPSIRMLSTYGPMFPTKRDGGFNYTDFLGDRWSNKEALGLPNWKWLYLKPEIVEEILEYMRISGESFDDIERYPDNPVLWFLFPKDRMGHFQNIQRELDKMDYKPNNTEKDETELQNKETPVRGDSEQTANRICYRKGKAQFVIRHISHQGSPFRC